MEAVRRSYLPAAGLDWLLPLYDPLQWLLGVEASHCQLVEQADLGGRQRILEIGCGTGNLTILIKRLHPESEVVGLDPDPKALARAGRKADQQALPLRLNRGFSDELPYPDRSFDRVFSAFMLHHLGLDQTERTLADAARVLVPGGSLHVVDIAGSTPGILGVVSRLFHGRGHVPAGEHGIAALMRAGGFADARETSHRTTLVGRVGFYAGTR